MFKLKSRWDRHPNPGDGCDGRCGPSRWEVGALLITAVSELIGLWLQIKDRRKEDRDAEEASYTRHNHGYTLIDELDHFKTECRVLRDERDNLQGRVYRLEEHCFEFTEGDGGEVEAGESAEENAPA